MGLSTSAGGLDTSAAASAAAVNLIWYLAKANMLVQMRAVHWQENPTKIQLEPIEVQTESYFGEDDIIRIEDDYQRS